MSASIRPENPVKPVPEEHLRAVLKAYDVTEAVGVVGIRGYVKQFKESTEGGNLVGKYDDVICIVRPGGTITYLGNTDPTRLIVDPTTHLGRAVLQAGHRYRYQRGLHHLNEPEKRYPAWVQAGPVIIRRSDEHGVLGSVITGQWIGCNIHSGAWSTTGSAACQTVVPERWKSFDSSLDAALKSCAQTQFWYCLTE